MPRLPSAKKDGQAAKICGDLQTGNDPQLPNGTTMMLKTSYTNSGRTRRTETSRYPQEEKETSISRVVASEKERAKPVPFRRQMGV